MELYSKRKILLLVLAVCIALPVIFAEVLAADHGHDCIGEGCPVCLQIEAAAYFLKTLKPAGIGLLLALCSVFSNQSGKNNNKPAAVFMSPVTLKVRYNS